LVKVLIPVGELVSRKLITQALHVLSTFKNPTIVLFHVVEVPSRTATLDPELYRPELDKAEEKLSDLAEWLTRQSLRVRVKVVVARNVAEGIIDETETGDYFIVFLMKRRFKRGWRQLFKRSVSQKVVRFANALVLTAPVE
jgi:nucleotide-binding universal stress UspA family protein